MSYVVPTGSELPDYEQEVDLGGTVYRLRLTYNGRDDSWYLSCMDAAGTPLVEGVRLTIGVSVLDPHVTVGLPDGVLMVIDPEVLRRDPSRESLNDDAMALVFVTRAELSA
jgi:hypothetical protein